MSREHESAGNIFELGRTLFFTPTDIKVLCMRWPVHGWNFQSELHSPHGAILTMAHTHVWLRTALWRGQLTDPKAAGTATVYIHKANWDHPDGPRILARVDAKVIRFKVILPDEILTLPVYQWWTSAHNNACMRYLGHIYRDQLGWTWCNIPGVLRGAR